MPSPAKAHSTAVVSWPLPATERYKTGARDTVALSNDPLGASVLGTFPQDKETAVVDASDSDGHLVADKKRLEIQAAQVRPRSQPPSQPNCKSGSETKPAENLTGATAAPTAAATPTPNGTTNARSSAGAEEKQKAKSAACGAGAAVT